MGEGERRGAAAYIRQEPGENSDPNGLCRNRALPASEAVPESGVMAGPEVNQSGGVGAGVESLQPAGESGGGGVPPPPDPPDVPAAEAKAHE
eukprot:13448457-Alexandrium_andersonii.AAC.1